MPGADFQAPGVTGDEGPYRDSEVMRQRWFPKPEVRLHTPGAKEARWATVEEAYAFIDELAAGRENLEVRTIGESLLGVPIKALFHKTGDAEALTVLVQARAHGNEPASTEGALELAKSLADGDLQDLPVNVIVIPVLNPEGARKMERRTGTDIDPNRDYVLQNSACIRAVYGLMQAFDPEVVLDIHEHRALAWPFDLMVIEANNPNIPLALREFTAEKLIGAMEDALEAADLRIGPYRLLDIREEGIRVRESATTFVSEKNGLAMGGRISLLTEGRGIGLGTQHFHRRTMAQYLSSRAVVETAARYRDEIKDLVQESRRQIAEETETWVLRVDPVELPQEHAFLDTATNDLKMLPTTYWERTRGKVTAKVQRPEAYVIGPDQLALVDRLKRFGLRMERLARDTEMEVEIMEVEAFESGTTSLYGGRLERPEDGALVRPAVRRNHEISLRTKVETRKLPAGSWVIPTDQALSLYLITLEPTALSSFAALSFWGSDLPVGFEFPVYRLR